MSRLASLLLVVVSATAFADTADPPASPPKPEEATTAPPAAKSSKFPLRVVKVMPESEQVLLFDKGRGRHVLVELGDTVGDYTVSSIDADEVKLTGIEMPVEVVLAVNEAKKKPAKKIAEATTEATTESPEDPYADAPAKKKAPADPYADVEDETAREISAALEDRPEAPVKAKSWSATTAEGEKSTTSPFATMDANAAKPSEDVATAGIPKAPPKAKPAPVVEETFEDEAVAPASAPAKPIAPTAKADAPTNLEGEPVAIVDEAPAKPVVPTVKADAPTKLARKDVNVALGDFGALSKSIDGAFGEQGLSIAMVAPRSVFAQAGLQPGDVVTAVNGKPLRTIDDAADLYARAGSMKSASVAIVRAGKPQTLRVVIQ